MAPAFAPVSEEVFEADLEVVEGCLPPDLSGAYVRTGPNPALPVEGGYHVRLPALAGSNGYDRVWHCRWRPSHRVF